MSEAKIAAKAFIVRDNKLLIIKRSDDEAYMPSVWEIPGGKIDPGEDPHLGLKREAKEETGLNIEIIKPLNVQFFQREDLGAITMIIFECNADKGDVILNKKEHSDYKWVDLNEAKDKLRAFFHGEVDMFNNLSK